MKIVIDIHERDYQWIKENPLTYDSEYCEAIRNGTPLPKGHGRLIDADAIIAEATESMKYPANHEYMECVIAYMNLAPTIIEADKESEEKEMPSSPKCIVKRLYHNGSISEHERDKLLKALEQEPKTGHWIMHDNGAWWECSECHTERAYGNEYCPDCGSHNGDIAKMFEPQEGEDKE
jgi:hypothetical protein